MATLLWALALHLVTVTMVMGQRNPSISFISKDKVINIGDTLELKCQVQDAASYPVAWTKLGRENTFISRNTAIVIPGDRHQLVYSDKDSTYTLIIHKVQEIDVGTYRCEITTSVDKNVRIVARIREPIFNVSFCSRSKLTFQCLFAFRQSYRTILRDLL